MNFQTPLGTVATDQRFVDTIVRHYGDGLFADPFAHLPEHSIELELVVLQHLFPDRPFRIVPILVGSFQDCVAAHLQPSRVDDIAAMTAAIRAAEASAGEPVTYIISGDLAHIGPEVRRPRTGSRRTVERQPRER
jgi:MEMO1 family protein